MRTLRTWNGQRGTAALAVVLTPDNGKGLVQNAQVSWAVSRLSENLVVPAVEMLPPW